MFKKVIAVAMAAVMALTVAPVGVKAAEASMPATNFDNIETKPVISYKFDGKDEGLELKGAAKLENGVLVLSPKNEEMDNDLFQYGETYAKIKSFAGIDFSKGFSWTADIKMKQYLNQWCSFMCFGNEDTIGQGLTKKDRVAYHFDSDLDHVMDIAAEDNNNKNVKYGTYFSGAFTHPSYTPDGIQTEIAEENVPYDGWNYEYFQDPDHWDEWLSMTTTISPEGELNYYVNGKLVKHVVDDEYGSIKAIFDAVNSGKFTNNLLGATYWGKRGWDADTMCDIDNVGIYNTVLTAEDAKNLTAAKAKEQVVTTPTVVPYTPSEKKTCSIQYTDGIKAGSKKVEVYLSATASKVNQSTITVNGKAATVKFSGKVITGKLSKALKKGDKVVITIAGKGYNTYSKSYTVKGIYKLSKVKVKKGAKKVTGKVSAKGATVKVKVGKKKAKKAKVKGKAFTLKCAALKKGTKVKITVSGKGYSTLNKTYKVK